VKSLHLIEKILRKNNQKLVEGSALL